MPQRHVPHAPSPTFRLRRGRLGPRAVEVLDRLWPAYGVDVDGSPVDLGALFGRAAPVVLEVGAGMGEATAAAALADPARDLLAVDVHTPGHAALLGLVEELGLTNVRVADGDARLLLARGLAPGSLDEVRVWFPDPWPKARHAKRRLVGPAFLDLVASRLRTGGLLHVATDWPPYADSVVQAVEAHPDLVRVPAEQVPTRPTTRFERRGVAAGRPVTDIAATRR